MHVTNSNQSQHYNHRASYANYIIKSNYWCQLIIFYFRSVSLIKIERAKWAQSPKRQEMNDPQKIIKILINSMPFQFWRMIFFILFRLFEVQYALAFSTDWPQIHTTQRNLVYETYFSVVCLFSIAIEQRQKKNVFKLLDECLFARKGRNFLHLTHKTS